MAHLTISLEDNDLEYYGSGDGVEYEVWVDPNTNLLYRVPIEIVRDFKSMKQVGSEHEAKFGTP